MWVKASNFHSQVLDDGAIQWYCVVRPYVRTQRNTRETYKMSRFPHLQPQYNDVMSQGITWSWNGFRTCCWRCCCCSAFFRPGKRHSTLWSRLSPSGDWESCCSEEKHFTERWVTCRVSDAHVTENKDGISPLCLKYANRHFCLSTRDYVTVQCERCQKEPALVSRRATLLQINQCVMVFK